jgi:hypothetical protein
MNLTKKLGMLLLAAFLVVYGLVMVLSLSFQHMNLVMGILAIAAGVLIALER